MVNVEAGEYYKISNQVKEVVDEGFLNNKLKHLKDRPVGKGMIVIA